MKKVLITGATGFLGYRLTEKMAKRIDVDYLIAAGRELKKGAVVQSEKVHYILGDLINFNYIQKLFTYDFTHIIHCAALSSPWGSYQEFRNANVIPIVNLLKMAEQKGTPSFINISSPSIYFNYSNQLNIKEGDSLPTRFVNNYAATKREAELLLEKSGVNYISLRPRAIIGRGDRVILPRLIKALEKGKLPIIGNGKTKVDLTSVENVVHAIELCLDAPPNAFNQHFNITNGKPVILWDKIKYTSEHLGITFPKKKVPLDIIRNVALLMEGYARLFKRGEPLLTQYSVATLALDFTLNIEKARSLLGYEPIVTIEDSINEFITWYKNNSNV